jgi:soluble lytic murein transglycosylase-like protein
MIVPILIVVLLVLSGTFFYNARGFYMTDKQLFRIAVEWNEKVRSHSFADYHMTLAIIAVESAGNDAATSGVGARGLMQIMEGALEDFNLHTNSKVAFDAMYDPGENIQVGSWYFQHLKTYYGLSSFDALRAYNAGIGTIGQSATAANSYARKVCNYRDKLQRLIPV